MKLYTLTVHELHDLMSKKEITAEETVLSVLERINKKEPDIQSFITVTADEAIKQAKAVDAKIMSGEPLSALAGIPMAVKDNICTADIRTTCGSKMLSNFVPPYDAAVYSELKNANAVLLGKLNMDEFAMGSSTENSYFKATKNPYDTNRVPGGSSGGCAAAVSCNEAVFAIGSDTGGSVRQPAALCAAVGLKPTYGLVSRYGLVAFASSLDQIGPITKDVTDCALVLNTIAGYDKRDSTSVVTKKTDYTNALTNGVKGLKIGVPEEYMGEGVSQDIKNAIYRCLEILKSMGAEYEECSLTMSDYALSTYYVISSAEASSNLARYDGIRYGYRTADYVNLEDLYVNTRTEGFGEEVKRRIMLGTYVLTDEYYNAYYKKAQHIRTLIKRDFDKAFERYDVLITPVSPTTAWKFGEKTTSAQMHASDICTVAVNVAGLPAISIPCGFDQNSLPIGMQIIAKAFDEETLLKIGYNCEQALCLPVNNVVKGE